MKTFHILRINQSHWSRSKIIKFRYQLRATVYLHTTSLLADFDWSTLIDACFLDVVYSMPAMYACNKIRNYPHEQKVASTYVAQCSCDAHGPSPVVHIHTVLSWCPIFLCKVTLLSCIFLSSTLQDKKSFLTHENSFLSVTDNTCKWPHRKGFWLIQW